MWRRASGRSGADTAELADWVVDSPLIDGVIFTTLEEGEPAIPVRAVARARGFTGHGKGLTQSAALASAVGEALEQYAAGQICRSRLIRARFSEISREAFDPRWLCLYSDEQYRQPRFPYKEFDEQAPLHWISGRWLDTGEPVYLPASAVYLSADLAPEALCQMTSNGLAAGGCVESAVHNAVMELYERDSFVSSWIACCNAMPTVVDGFEQQTMAMLRQCELSGARMELYLVARGDPAFVAVCIGLGDGVRWPAVTMGLGAASHLDEAVRRAVLEHGQTGTSLAHRWRKGELHVPNRPEQVRTLQDQAAYYCGADHLSEFNEWRLGARYAAEVTRDDVRIAVVDLTPDELADSPYRVVRALGRGLQPIHVGFGFERLHTAWLKRLLGGRSVRKAVLPVC